MSRSPWQWHWCRLIETFSKQSDVLYVDIVITDGVEKDSQSMLQEGCRYCRITAHCQSKIFTFLAPSCESNGLFMILMMAYQSQLQ